MNGLSFGVAVIRNLSIAALAFAVGAQASCADEGEKPRGKVVELIGGKDSSGAPKLRAPFGIAANAAGDFFVAEYRGHRVLKFDRKGELTVIGGTGEKGYGGDGGPAKEGKFNAMHDLVVSNEGDIYLADSDNYRVRKIDGKTGILSTFAGNGTRGIAGDGGPAEKASLDGVASLFFDPSGKVLYLAGFSKVVRKVDLATGVIETVPRIPGGRSVLADPHGNIYVAGGKTLRVRRADGSVETLLDGSNRGGAELELCHNPKHMALDADGNLLLAEDLHHRVRKYLVKEKKLVEFAGTGTKGTAGVGGFRETAQVNGPHGVYFHAASGAVLICDSWNDRVLRIDP